MTTRSSPYTHAAGAHPELPTEADVMARASRENFRVASRLLPRKTREHLLAFYGYARFVDQIGDEYAGDRLAALDWIEAETRRSLADPGAPGGHPLIARAVASVAALGTDPAPLFALIAANRQDQVVSAYRTVSELRAYCELSANPVGRLVLAAFGSSTPERVRWSDAICTGLQLVEHWQDIAEDAAAGRVYLPAEDLDRFGVRPADLVAPPPAGPGLRALVAFEVLRARHLLDEGAPLIRSLDGRLRWAVAGFWAGGHAALDAIAACRFDPLAGASRPAPARVARRLVAGLGSEAATREAA
jgi:squalene synthase HpnC